MQTIDTLLSIKFDQNKLSYKKIPGGKKNLLLFHGFGQNHKLFSPWFDELSKQFTIYSFDVFYHGKSRRPDRFLSKKEWLNILKIFLEKEKIDHFSIGGFSLGGRFVIASALLLPDKIENVILIAPDGIYRSFWYNMATFPPMHGIFKYLMKHPSFFNSILDYFEKNNLANESLIRFSRKELGPKGNRVKVYRSWVYLKPLKFRNEKIRRSFQKYEFKTFLIMGSRDNIVPPNEISPVFGDLRSVQTIISDKKHHELINASNLQQLLEYLSD